MTAIASLLSTAATPALATSPTGAPVALPAFLDLLAPATKVAVTGKAADADGKDVPVAAIEAGEEGDKALAFVSAAYVLVPPVPAPVAIPAGTIAAPTARVAAATSPTIRPGEGRDPVATGPLLDPGLRRAGQLLEVPTGNSAPAAADTGAIISSSPHPGEPATVTSSTPTEAQVPSSKPVSTPAREMDAPSAPARVAPASPTTPAPLATATPAPAAQVFADAIHRAVTRDDERPADPTQPLAAPTTATLTTAVAASAQAHGGALDMRHEQWPQAMVERIAMLRDMAAENDTSIRLAPDALGNVDVSLRRDGDGVSVQITAEQPHARQLLAEAQPRLAELAAERGIRLNHGTQTAQGGGGDAPRHQQPQGAALPHAPVSAFIGADADTDDEQRIA